MKNNNFLTNLLGCLYAIVFLSQITTAFERNVLLEEFSAMG